MVRWLEKLMPSLRARRLAEELRESKKAGLIFVRIVRLNWKRNSVSTEDVEAWTARTTSAIEAATSGKEIFEIRRKFWAAHDGCSRPFLAAK